MRACGCSPRADAPWRSERAGPRHGADVLPSLGGNSIARHLGPEVIADVSTLLRESIAHGLEHLDEAVDWLLARNGPLDTPERVREYLWMYANQRTLEYGPEGRRGVQVFLERAASEGLIGRCEVDWAP